MFCIELASPVELAEVQVVVEVVVEASGKGQNRLFQVRFLFQLLLAERIEGS